MCGKVHIYYKKRACLKHYKNVLDRLFLWFELLKNRKCIEIQLFLYNGQVIVNINKRGKEYIDYQLELQVALRYNNTRCI